MSADPAMISSALGLLLLRCLLGLLLFGHAAQKLFGWFTGAGVKGTAIGFEKWGLRPGWIFVVMAGASEALGAVLIILGAVVPVASMIVIATMTVAIAFNWPRGFWANRGGYEVALCYAAIAFILAMTGPGEWSVDAWLSLGAFHGVVWALGALILGILGAVGTLLLRNQKSLLINEGAG